MYQYKRMNKENVIKIMYDFSFNNNEIDTKFI